MTPSSRAIAHDPAANRRPEPVSVEIVDAGPARLPFPGARMIHVFCVFALVLSGAASILMPEARAAAQSGGSGTATAIADLNLRSGPGTWYQVLTVIPANGAVAVTGGTRAGFLPVTFRGVSGYSSAEYLQTGGSTPDRNEESNDASNEGATGDATVLVDYLNLRADAHTGAAVISVMAFGETVSLLGGTRNGFSQVTYRGTDGWTWSDYIESGAAVAPDPGSGNDDAGNGNDGNGPTGTATTTTSLNLRSGPGLGNAVIDVMPAGASVTLSGASQDGFVEVTYRGQQGWASDQYLTTGGDTTPEPDPVTPPTNPDPAPDIGDAPSGQIWATTAVNLRSGPGTSYSVLTVVAGGGTLLATGQSQNGFWSVNYNGISGWASADLLTTDGSDHIDPPATDPGPGGVYTEAQIIDIIYAAADAYGQPRSDMLRVARCESVLDPNAVNQAGGSYGLFQFLPGTWATTPYAQYDIFDPVANANAAAWMWSVGRRNEWVCQ